jgi:hypothetical protein
MQVLSSVDNQFFSAENVGIQRKATMPVRMRVFAFLLLCPITSGLLVSPLTSGRQLGLFRKQGDICLPKMQRNLLVASGQHVSSVYTRFFIHEM